VFVEQLKTVNMLESSDTVENRNTIMNLEDQQPFTDHDGIATMTCMLPPSLTFWFLFLFFNI
jgi:hypothetical protein